MSILSLSPVIALVVASSLARSAPPTTGKPSIFHRFPPPKASPSPGSAAPGAPMYDRLGQMKGIERISSAFVDELASDGKLLANPALGTAARKVNRADAKRRLAAHICRAIEGPCHPNFPLVDPKVLGPDTKLGYWDWFYLARDANSALDRAGVGWREKKELLALLWRQKDRMNQQ